MRQLGLIYTIVITFIISCNSKDKEAAKMSPEGEALISQNLNFQRGKAFFDFDHVDYYYNDMDENTASNLITIQRSALDSLKYDLLIDDRNELLDSVFSDENFRKTGFIKKTIADDDLKKLRILFSESPERESVAFACIPIYRDLLVFRKKGMITGVGKICFGCNRSKILGARINTNNFGQGKDYEILSIILNQYKKIN